MNECKQLRDLLGPYLYGDVTDEERSRVDAHLNACEACREHLDACRSLSAQLPGDLLRPSEAAEARVLQAVQGRIAQHRRRASERLQRRASALRLAAVAATALVAGMWIGHRVSGGPRAPTPGMVSSRPSTVEQTDVASAARTPATEAPTPGAERMSTPAPSPTPPTGDEPVVADVARPSMAAALIEAPRPHGPDDVTLAVAPNS
jgi:predicted anti-sigma-YlaC factor YlaD